MSVILEGVGAADFTTGAQWNEQFLPAIIKNACSNLGVNASHWGTQLHAHAPQSFVPGVEARASALLCHHPDIHAVSRPSYSIGGPPQSYLTREELDDPKCGWEFHLKAPRQPCVCDSAGPPCPTFYRRRPYCFSFLSARRIFRRRRRFQNQIHTLASH